MKRIIIILLLFSFPLLMKGADIPEVVEDNNDYNQQSCIDNVTNNCMNTVCVNSPDINCTDNCQANAQNQCAAQNGTNNPEVINENNNNNQQTCIDSATNNCINTICPTSDDLNCSSNCQADAQNSCAGQSE